MCGFVWLCGVLTWFQTPTVKIHTKKKMTRIVKSPIVGNSNLASYLISSCLSMWYIACMFEIDECMHECKNEWMQCVWLNNRHWRQTEDLCLNDVLARIYTITGTIQTPAMSLGPLMEKTTTIQTLAISFGPLNGTILGPLLMDGSIEMPGIQTIQTPAMPF